MMLNYNVPLGHEIALALFAFTCGVWMLAGAVFFHAWVSLKKKGGR